MSASHGGGRAGDGRYHRPHRRAWFMERPAYVRFMIRELTSVFIAGYLVVLIVTLAKAGGGTGDLAAWLQSMTGPWWVAAHVVALAAAVWHSVTWFSAVPQAMPLYLGERKLPSPVAAVLMGYGPWLTVTALIVAWALWASGRV